jgi:tripartite-type tricarboxylate transporter receptor subunit TctC
MRRILLTILGIAGLAFGQPVVGQDYPSKPIRIIVPLAAGGGTDTLAREIGEKLREKWNQPVLVENRPGAAGNIGAEAVFRAPPDGYTLLFTQPAPLVVNTALYAKLGYDPEQFVPVALVSLQDMMLAVNPNVPAKTVQELIAFGKANPGKLTFGSSGAGSAPHLAAELLSAKTGVKMVHVPYKGSAESMRATIGGEVDLTLFAFSSALPQAKAGKLRALGVGRDKRNEQLAEVPSVSEVVPGFTATSFTALVAPPGTPTQVVEKLSQAVSEIIKQPGVRTRMKDAGDEPFDSTPAQMATFLREERQRWGDLIRTVGITAQ